MSEENIKNSLLIIKAKETSLTSVESFLRNRDWKIHSTTNIKDALVYISQQQPQFVMVCIDHPNQKIRKLPKVLTQAFPVNIIAFTEGTSASSYSLLNASAIEYMIYPPVTGPAVERTVNKFFKDQQTKQNAQAHARAGGAAGEDGVISIRGDSLNHSTKDAHSILANMLGEDAPELAIMTGHKASDMGSSAEGIGAGAAKEAQAQGAGMGANHSANSQGPGAGHMHTAHPGLEDSDSSDYRSHQSRKKSAGHWAPLPQKAPAKKDRLTPEELESHPKANKSESIILKGTKAALETSCKITSFEKSQSIEESTNVACIVVESARFSGYLITAMGKNKKLDDHFLKKVRERLFKFLKENGEDIKEGDSMDLKIKQVPFEDWALEYAEFMRKSIHDGNEVAMAFFPRPDIKTEYQESHAEEMASIKIDEFQGDTNVEFNVYIRLPRNDKYILYTPRGGMFYNNQKERLRNQGIMQLHIMKAELPDVDKYRAQNFLNEKITDFEEKERQRVLQEAEKKVS